MWLSASATLPEHTSLGGHVDQERCGHRAILHGPHDVRQVDAAQRGELPPLWLFWRLLLPRVCAVLVASACLAAGPRKRADTDVMLCQDEIREELESKDVEKKVSGLKTLVSVRARRSPACPRLPALAD